MLRQEGAILPKPTNTSHARQCSGRPSCSPQVGTNNGPETGTTSLGCKMDRKRDGQVLPATYLSLRRVPWFWLTGNLK